MQGVRVDVANRVGEGEGEVEGEARVDELRRLRRHMGHSENIILCIDVGEEMGTAWTVDKTRMQALTDALAIFVKRKAASILKHQFAIVTFGNIVELVLPFTNDMHRIIDTLRSLEIQPLERQVFDLSDLFDTIQQRLSFPAAEPANASTHGRIIQVGGANDVTVRACIVFGRSHNPPLVRKSHPLLSQQYFHLDVLYLHKKVNEDGVQCQEVFDALTTLEPQDSTKHSYFFETAPSALRLVTYLTMMLAHCAQREFQEDMLAKFEVSSDRLRELKGPQTHTHANTSTHNSPSPPHPPESARATPPQPPNPVALTHIHTQSEGSPAPAQGYAGLGLGLGLGERSNSSSSTISTPGQTPAHAPSKKIWGIFKK